MKQETHNITPYLPYALRGKFGKYDDVVTEIDAVHHIISSLNNGSCEIKHFKPYLRHLESITNDELYELCQIWGVTAHLITYSTGMVRDALCDTEGDLLKLVDGIFMNMEMFWQTTEYLHSKHFDLKGLIDAGLALNK